MPTSESHLSVDDIHKIQPEIDRLEGWERSSGLLFAVLLVPAVLVAAPLALLIALRERVGRRRAAGGLGQSLS
ncbi:hypothetical protein Q8W71_21905 [Methylobacterium sp. NEAU 140]|uniref:hypothetical protein n=1 Tax=Methylobacterium sp. NEAU 140 TaxID=3064945 RepID=UPI00273260E5|nr:hypothetical protein [Methylobacterium sp. NEAU 140]MDP4025289.1 hypothetical protein [Methylobacterium sp. NEAU 140]